jgi:acetyl esterase/lipase
VGDLEIQADVYRLPGDDVRPAVIWIHGGALIMGDRDMQGWRPLERQLERYLQAGYVVISIDYRLAPETKFPAIIEDLQDAYAWVHEQGTEEFNIDPNRIAVIGSSAGGYLTLMAGFCVEPRPKALVAFYGYGDIIGPWYSQPDPFYNREPPVSEERARRAVGDRPIARSPFDDERDVIYVFCRQRGLWPQEVVGMDPAKEREAFTKYCPLQNISPEYPPTLLLHGDKDSDVPYEQSVFMADELKRHGVEYKLLTMQGHDHMFDLFDENAPEVKAAIDEVIVFLNNHLRE